MGLLDRFKSAPSRIPCLVGLLDDQGKDVGWPLLATELERNPQGWTTTTDLIWSSLVPCTIHMLGIFNESDPFNPLITVVICPCCRRVTTDETEKAFIEFHNEEDQLLNQAAEKILELINKPRMATGTKTVMVYVGELEDVRSIFLRFKALDDAKIEHQHAIDSLITMTVDLGRNG